MTLSITRVSFTVADGRRSTGKATPPRPPLLIIGPCAADAPMPINTARYVTMPDQAVEQGLHGPLVEAACYALAYEDRRVFMMRADVTAGTPGAYGDVDVSDFASDSAPDVEADTVILPEDDLEPAVEFVTGGTLGTAGITYRYRTGSSSSELKGTFALGTDTSITLPHGAGKFNLYPPEDLVVALVTELRADFLLHIGDTSSHGAADSGPYTIGSAPGNRAEAQTVMGQLLTAGIAHVQKTTSIHGASDSTALSALNAITAPTTPLLTVAAANAFKTVFFGASGHAQRISSSIHVVADTTHVIAAPNASAGVITAGDSFSTVTTAPRWSVSELGDAIDAARDMSKAFSLIEIAGPVLTGVEADAIAQKIEGLRTKQKFKRAIIQFRMREIDESLDDYAEAYETAFGSTVQRRLGGPTPSLYLPSAHPERLGQVDARPFSFALAPRIVTKDEVINPTDEEGFGSIVGYVRDSSDALLPRAVDDNLRELFTPLRAMAPRTIDGESLNSIFCGQGGMLAPEGSDYAIIPFARVVDLACEVAYPALRKRLGKKVAPAGDGSGRMDPNERKRIDAQVTEILAARLVKTGQAVAVSVAIDPETIVVGAPPITAKVKIRVEAFGYIDEFEIEVSLG